MVAHPKATKSRIYQRTQHYRGLLFYPQENYSLWSLPSVPSRFADFFGYNFGMKDAAGLVAAQRKVLVAFDIFRLLGRESKECWQAN